MCAVMQPCALSASLFFVFFILFFFFFFFFFLRRYLVCKCASRSCRCQRGSLLGLSLFSLSLFGWLFLSLTHSPLYLVVLGALSPLLGRCRCLLLLHVTSTTKLLLLSLFFNKTKLFFFFSFKIRI